MNKVKTLEEIKSLFKDDMTIMIGGFLGNGAPLKLIDALVEKNVKNLTIIGNDTCFENQGVGKLLANGQVKKIVASYIGGNTETGRLMNEGKLEAELIPQGSLAEKIRAAGAGLGGILTPTGVGTIVADGKDTITVNNREYLLEMPIKADLALIKGSIVDDFGNVVYKGTTKNFNTSMALAGDLVIVEAETLVRCGEIDPDLIHTPGVIVDYIFKEDTRND